jgi:hypothetical protein
MNIFICHVVRRRGDENSFVDHVVRRRWEVQWLFNERLVGGWLWGAQVKPGFP